MNHEKIVIITPTTGSRHLGQCIQSVQNQTYPVRHLLVVDGQQHLANVAAQMQLCHRPPDHVVLPENVGSGGWYGHRIYAAFTYLVNDDFIIYLDEDNWLEPNHVESLVAVQQSNQNGWAYALRNICDQQGSFICQDNCESLGVYPTFHGYHHIDTSCYFLPRAIATTAADAWYGQFGADRKFFGALMNPERRYVCSKQHTVNYRLGGESGGTQDWIVNGNAIMSNTYAGCAKFPWH